MIGSCADSPVVSFRCGYCDDPAVGRVGGGDLAGLCIAHEHAPSAPPPSSRRRGPPACNPRDTGKSCTTRSLKHITYLYSISYISECQFYIRSLVILCHYVIQKPTSGIAQFISESAHSMTKRLSLRSKGNQNHSNEAFSSV